MVTFVKIIENLLAGAAVAAHRLPQTEALACDTMWHAPDMTAKGLAAAIGDLVAAPERARALGAAALRRFEQRISWECIGGPRLGADSDQLFGSLRVG